MWMRQEWHLCKLHNEVFKAAESRINTECLPFAGRDESVPVSIEIPDATACPSQEGMNRLSLQRLKLSKGLPFAGRDESERSETGLTQTEPALRRKG